MTDRRVPDDWFLSFMEAAPDVYFRYSLQPARGFVYVSPAIGAVTGHSAAAFYAEPELCLRLIARDDRPTLRQIARARRPLTVGVRIADRKGALVPLALRVVPVVRGGQLMAVEGVAVRDAGRLGRASDGPAGEPEQQKLAALMYEVHALLHKVLPKERIVRSEHRLGPIALDVSRMAVSLDGEAVGLTSRELMVLKYLLEHPGRLVTREQLLQEVWGYSYTGDVRTVDVHMSRLRKKLPPLRDYLRVLRHLGYRLEVPGEVRAVNE